VYASGGEVFEPKTAERGSLMKQIGGTLRAIRQQLKLTLREVDERCRIFAEETGHDSYRISASWLNRLERAEHKLTAKQLLVLAHIYGLQPEQLFRTMYPDSLGRDPPPSETTLLSPESGPSPGPYKWGIIGKHDHTLEPLVPIGSIVQIDTRKREISPHQAWAQELQRPIYFLKTRAAYFCGWCEFDPLRELLTLVPHPLSPAPRRSWKYPREVEIIGRVVATSIRFTLG
jgi:transcriptional regulator with XRE-family HTH domain